MKKLGCLVGVLLCLSFLFSVVVPSASAYRGGYHHGGHCFIATAAYGNENHPYVLILREFRDRYLLSNSAGTYMVEVYYENSPAVAKFIDEHNSLKPVTKVALLPFIGVSYLMNQL